MKRETAVELANAWYDLVEHTGAAGNLYGGIQAALMSLLPEDIDAGAVGPVDGKMAVLAMRGQRLFILRPQNADGNPTEMHVDCLPVVSGDVCISVTDNPKDMADADPPGHFRRWVFTWNAGSRVELLGEVRRMRHFRGDGPDSAELFARAVAEQLGWNVPAQR